MIITPYFSHLSYFSSCSSFHCVKFYVVSFSGNSVFKMNIEVFCHFAAVVQSCLDTILLSAWCPIVRFWFLSTILLHWWSLAILWVLNHNYKDFLNKQSKNWTFNVTDAPAKQICPFDLSFLGQDIRFTHGLYLTLLNKSFTAPMFVFAL